MNPVTRLLGLGLLVVLTALTAMVAVPAFRSLHRDAAEIRETSSRRATSNNLAALPQRMSFPLAVTALVLAAALVASLAFTSPATTGSHATLRATETEMSAITLLAQTSVAQREALVHERDGRQRAEENALLNQTLLNRALEEKIRLGRDLHDGIIQSLYAAGLVIESARAIARTDPTEADRRLAQCLKNLNRSIRDVRAYIVGLTPDNLRFAGFAQALQAVADELRGNRDVIFDLKIDDAATTLLTAEQSVEALQIAREAMSNSLRHGAASRVTVRLHQDASEICLLVQDDGKGFDPQQMVRLGHGMGNMAARAERIRGNVRIESQPGGGSRVILTLPLQTTA
jgi:signal transduction histidine kinase